MIVTALIYLYEDITQTLEFSKHNKMLHIYPHSKFSESPAYSRNLYYLQKSSSNEEHLPRAIVFSFITIKKVYINLKISLTLSISINSSSSSVPLAPPIFSLIY